MLWYVGGLGAVQTLHIALGPKVCILFGNFRCCVFNVSTNEPISYLVKLSSQNYLDPPYARIFWESGQYHRSTCIRPVGSYIMLVFTHSRVAGRMRPCGSRAPHLPARQGQDRVETAPSAMLASCEREGGAAAQVRE